MLAVTPLRDIKDERKSEMERFSIVEEEEDGDFPDFSSGNFLDSIDFDDLFVGINDGDLLPDLEMDYSDQNILAEFSLSGGEESFEKEDYNYNNNNINDSRTQEVDKASSEIDQLGSFPSSNNPGEDGVSKLDESDGIDSNREKKGKKSSSSHQSKGKRKVKVDWTPELHRRFVQAVEQLGVDKAVPSRILEIMGIDCLTRHNIASHLQKYRSHKKHLLAREAEAANWNHRRQVYGGAPPPIGGKRDTNPWLAPIIGFPPMTHSVPHFRPLHVWGHPSVDQPLMHVWPPKHLATSLPSPPRPPPTWTPPHSLHQPPADPSFWHGHHHRAPNTLAPGTPCFAPPMATTRFPTPPVPGIPPPNMYKVDLGVGFPTTPIGQTLPKPVLDFEPSKESIDAAIGDVLSKPWLPLPLRLKPPSVDSVIVELQRQGIANVPPPSI